MKLTAGTLVKALVQIRGIADFLHGESGTIGVVVGHFDGSDDLPSVYWGRKGEEDEPHPGAVVLTLKGAGVTDMSILDQCTGLGLCTVQSSMIRPDHRPDPDSD